MAFHRFDLMVCPLRQTVLPDPLTLFESTATFKEIVSLKVLIYFQDFKWFMV